MILPQAQVSNLARSARIRYNEGVRLLNLGDSTRAVEQFESSLSHDSLYIPSHERLQDIFRFNLGKEDSIRTVYENLKNSYPDNAKYVYLAGRLLDIEEKESEFKRVIRLDSLFYWGYFGLGNIYLDEGLFDDAVEQFIKAVAINPAMQDAQLALGFAYENLDKVDSAVKQYKKSLLINPKVTPDAYYFLGIIYADRADTSQDDEQFKEYTSQSSEHLTQYLDLVKHGKYVDLARTQSYRMQAELDSLKEIEEIKKSEDEEKKKVKKTE